MGAGAIALVTALQEAWSARDSDGLASLFAPDGVREEWALPGARLVGREEIARHVGAYMQAVPDCLLVIRDAFFDSDHMTIEWTLTGTHKADLPGVPARDEELELPGVSVCQLRDGELAHESVYWDAATLLVVAGVLT